MRALVCIVADRKLRFAKLTPAGGGIGEKIWCLAQTLMLFISMKFRRLDGIDVYFLKSSKFSKLK
jgi:hypothetical protein